MKSSLKDAIYNYMFDILIKNRRDDLIRATQAVSSGSQRFDRGASLRKWYKKNVGAIKELSDEQLAQVRNAWGDIWDTGLVYPFWAELYTDKTGNFSPDYIGSDIHYYNVEWSMIDYDYLRAFLDKNYMDIILPCVKHPVTLIRKIHGMYLDADFNPITKAQAVDMLYENRDPGVVVKISRISSGGKGVQFIEKDNSKDDISEALDVDRDVTVQLVMKQHPEMAKMNESSVNTIRIICVMLDGESIPLSAVVRIGNKGSRVDNFSSGGISCGVMPDGHLKDCGYTLEGQKFSVHTNGFIFKDGFVPNFDKALDAVKRCHVRVPMFGVASWDIAIDSDGEPVLIEYNVSKASIDLHQYNNGPIYGEYKDRILKKAFKNYAVRSATIDYNYSSKGKTTISKGSKKVRNLVIPEELNGAPVRFIADSTFKENTKLESLTVNAELERIGCLSFYKCSTLNKITFNAAVKIIARSAFNTCPMLQTVKIPYGCEKIEMYAFRNCRSLKKIIIPETVTVMDPDIFLESEKTVIYCKKGSTAEEYARKYGMAYKSM